jgi:hypothetical protein
MFSLSLTTKKFLTQFLNCRIAKVKIFQAFLLSGGANGRLARGDEVFEMEFADGDSLENLDPRFLEVPTSL